eukprot:6532535-Pyramimonas_sp.AAC.1
MSTAGQETQRPHAWLLLLHDVGLGSEAAVGDGALAVTRGYGRAESAAQTYFSVAAGLEGRLATGDAVLQGLGHARRG